MLTLSPRTYIIPADNNFIFTRLFTGEACCESPFQTRYDAESVAVSLVDISVTKITDSNQFLLLKACLGIGIYDLKISIIPIQFQTHNHQRRIQACAQRSAP